MVLLLGLDLVNCSDKFENVSVAGRKRVSKNKDTRSNTFLDKYGRRKGHYDLTLHQYFHCWHKQAKGDVRKQWTIPHYTGSNTRPVFPVTNDYIKYAFIVHKPWRGKFDFKFIKAQQEFEDYLRNKHCPEILKMQYTQALQRFFSGTQYVEVVDEGPETREPTDEESQNLVALLNLQADDDCEDAGDVVLDYGRGYDWIGSNKDRSDLPDGKDWLINAVKESIQNEDPEDLDLPKCTDASGSCKDYDVELLTEDQKEIMFYVLKSIKMWLEDDPGFRPVQLTVRGKGGTGKTTLLKTITSVVRRMFNSKTAVQVSGPTGVCSCNAGGCTDHHLFGINSSNLHRFDVDDSLKQRLSPRFKDTVVLMLDERSMRCSRVLSRMELVARRCAHGGHNTQTPWGGIPVIIQFGDDHQLAPIDRGAVLIPLPGHGDIHVKPKNDRAVLRGNDIFLDFAEDVMDLQVIKRVDPHETQALERLERTRNDLLTEDDVEHFKRLHLEEGNFTKEERELIEDKSLWVFAKNEPKRERNTKMLKKVSVENGVPVAKMRAVYKGGSKLLSNNKRRRIESAVKKHFRDREDVDVIKICVGAKVCLQGRNFCPRWGLYNGAIGTVEEMHFEKTETGEDPDPNKGDYPAYVVVDFPHYRGPAWDPNSPKSVPIPVVTDSCDFHCCTRTFMPLDICFATTIHKLQGLTVGPSSGINKNAAESIIVDIGTRGFEQTSPGLFYTALSRSTTQGDADPMTSAIFFTGEDVTRERLTKMTRYKDVKKANYNTKIIRIRRRDAWIELLDAHVHDSRTTSEEKDLLCSWAGSVSITRSQLYDRIKMKKRNCCVL